MALGLSQKTPLGRGFARKLMTGLVRHLSGDKLDACLFGLKARLHTQNNSSEMKALMNPARYCRAEFAFFAKHMPKTGGVFVDVGANAGLFSLGAASLIEAGTILAFEPQAELFSRLCNNLIVLNPELAARLNIRLHNVAVGAVDGALDLYVPEQLGQASARAISGSERVSVRAEAMMSILDREQIKHVDVLKLDIEGFEDDVVISYLESAPDPLWPRAIILEHCHKERWQIDCEAFLIERGYRVVAEDRTNVMLSLAGG